MLKDCKECINSPNCKLCQTSEKLHFEQKKECRTCKHFENLYYCNYCKTNKKEFWEERKCLKF